MLSVKPNKRLGKHQKPLPIFEEIFGLGSYESALDVLAKIIVGRYLDDHCGTGSIHKEKGGATMAKIDDFG
jgi:hypothetical protein